MGAGKNWTTVAESQFPWEREALTYIRERFPEHEPYRAWSNFEFIADDGSINEVDLLIFSKVGFFLIEIKSRPGTITGDTGAWTWSHEGRRYTDDNPLIKANNKAKKLASLLQRQKAARKKGRLPFIEALVFCSEEEQHLDLNGTAALRVAVRDSDESEKRPARRGIMSAILNRDCPGLEGNPRGTHDRPTAKVVSQALEQAGIRPSERSRKVGDYRLEELIYEGPGYQDWRATHVTMKESQRRVRLYLVNQGATEEERHTIQRAAEREYQLAETLQHPGVLRAQTLTNHELGPALIFEHDPKAVRLDHYLATQEERLTVDERLGLLRQLAEVIAFAHDRRVVHRALSPQSVLIVPTEGSPRVVVYNWQAGFRAPGSTSGTLQVSATSHAEQLVEGISQAYMAPEATTASDSLGEHLDVFSLGAMTYHVFSGQPPASNSVELSDRLRGTTGLQINAVLNGVVDELDTLIQQSTHPDVSQRLVESVQDFQEGLDEVEATLTAPENLVTENPCHAKQGDLLEGGFQVVRRLGHGACSVALLVTKGENEFVLKAASDPTHNDRLRGEGEVLEKLRHAHIVACHDCIDLNGHTCLLLSRAGPMTLGQRLREEGPLSLDLASRFGDDLLDVVRFLEEQGIAHRDIKPDNIGVGAVGRGDKLHLILFDFSLSRAATDNIRCGTAGYLDPLLPLRKRWDLYAERYAAAVTLYECLTGVMPKWGDGRSDPSHAECEVTVEAELFEPQLRERLADFFRKAFRRDVKDRFHNADEMLEAWRACYREAESSVQPAAQEGDESATTPFADATFETQIAELGLSTRAANALDRANILTVEDFLRTSRGSLVSMRGVGNKTRRELADAMTALHERLGTPADVAPALDEAEVLEGSISVDFIFGRLFPSRTKKGDKEIVRALLGLDAELKNAWPSQSDVARHLGISPTKVCQVLSTYRHRWTNKEPAITRVRNDIAATLDSAGKVMALDELTNALLTTHGSHQAEPERSRNTAAVIRAALEVERHMAQSRFTVRRDPSAVLIAADDDLAGYALRLGRRADKLAQEEPLRPPTRAIEALRALKLPDGEEPLLDGRLLRLAVASSESAALSSRQEIYPRNMSAERALRLSQGVVMGIAKLKEENIRARVASRYPEAQPLPPRPKLDKLLAAAGLDLIWKEETQSYVSPAVERLTLTTGSTAGTRYATATVGAVEGAITPAVAEARAFEERLQRSVKDGGFLGLMIKPSAYQSALNELSRRFSPRVVDLEAQFLAALKAEAAEVGADWDLVLRTDGRPGDGEDWGNLMYLVRTALAKVEAALQKSDETILITYAGFLARYDQLGLIERLRDRIGLRDGLAGLWLLVPHAEKFLLDGKAVPVLSASQQVKVPDAWIRNEHRAHSA